MREVPALPFLLSQWKHSPWWKRLLLLAAGAMLLMTLATEGLNWLLPHILNEQAILRWVQAEVEKKAPVDLLVADLRFRLTLFQGFQLHLRDTKLVPRRSGADALTDKQRARRIKRQELNQYPWAASIPEAEVELSYWSLLLQKEKGLIRRIDVKKPSLWFQGHEGFQLFMKHVQLLATPDPDAPEPPAPLMGDTLFSIDKGVLIFNALEIQQPGSSPNAKPIKELQYLALHLPLLEIRQSERHDRFQLKGRLQLSRYADTINAEQIKNVSSPLINLELGGQATVSGLVERDWESWLKEPLGQQLQAMRSFQRLQVSLGSADLPGMLTWLKKMAPELSLPKGLRLASRKPQEPLSTEAGKQSKAPNLPTSTSLEAQLALWPTLVFSFEQAYQVGKADPSAYRLQTELAIPKAIAVLWPELDLPHARQWKNVPAFSLRFGGELDASDPRRLSKIEATYKDGLNSEVDFIGKLMVPWLEKESSDINSKLLQEGRGRLRLDASPFYLQSLAQWEDWLPFGTIAQETLGSLEGEVTLKQLEVAGPLLNLKPVGGEMLLNKLTLYTLTPDTKHRNRLQRVPVIQQGKARLLLGRDHVELALVDLTVGRHGKISAKGNWPLSEKTQGAGLLAIRRLAIAELLQLSKPLLQALVKDPSGRSLVNWNALQGQGQVNGQLRWKGKGPLPAWQGNVQLADAGLYNLLRHEPLITLNGRIVLQGHEAKHSQAAGLGVVQSSTANQPLQGKLGRQLPFLLEPQITWQDNRAVSQITGRFGTWQVRDVLAWQESLSPLFSAMPSVPDIVKEAQGEVSGWFRARLRNENLVSKEATLALHKLKVPVKENPNLSITDGDIVLALNQNELLIRQGNLRVGKSGQLQLTGKTNILTEEYAISASADGLNLTTLSEVALQQIELPPEIAALERLEGLVSFQAQAQGSNYQQLPDLAGTLNASAIALYFNKVPHPLRLAAFQARLTPDERFTLPNTAGQFGPVQFTVAANGHLPLQNLDAASYKATVSMTDLPMSALRTEQAFFKALVPSYELTLWNTEGSVSAQAEATQDALNVALHLNDAGFYATRTQLPPMHNINGDLYLNAKAGELYIKEPLAFRLGNGFFSLAELNATFGTHTRLRLEGYGHLSPLEFNNLYGNYFYFQPTSYPFQSDFYISYQQFLHNNDWQSPRSKQWLDTSLLVNIEELQNLSLSEKQEQNAKLVVSIASLQDRARIIQNLGLSPKNTRHPKWRLSGKPGDPESPMRVQLKLEDSGPVKGKSLLSQWLNPAEKTSLEKHRELALNNPSQVPFSSEEEDIINANDSQPALLAEVSPTQQQVPLEKAVEGDTASSAQAPLADGVLALAQAQPATPSSGFKDATPKAWQDNLFGFRLPEHYKPLAILDAQVDLLNNAVRLDNTTVRLLGESEPLHWQGVVHAPFSSSQRRIRSRWWFEEPLNFNDLKPYQWSQSIQVDAGEVALDIQLDTALSNKLSIYPGSTPTAETMPAEEQDSEQSISAKQEPSQRASFRFAEPGRKALLQAANSEPQLREPNSSERQPFVPGSPAPVPEALPLPGQAAGRPAYGKNNDEDTAGRPQQQNGKAITEASGPPPFELTGRINVSGLSSESLAIDALSADMEFMDRRLAVVVDKFATPATKLTLRTVSEPLPQWPIHFPEAIIQGEQFYVEGFQDVLSRLGQALAPVDIGKPASQQWVSAQGVVHMPFTVGPSPVAINNVIINNLILEDFKSELSLFANGHTEINAMNFSLASGDIHGTLRLSPSLNNSLAMSINADHVKANALTRLLLNVSNEVFGDLSGKIDFSTNGENSDTLVSNANGQASFVIEDGRLPTVAKIETLLTAANIVRGGVLGLNLGNLTRVLKPFNTNYFAQLSGDFQIAEGVMYTSNLSTNGKNLDLLIQGAIAMDTGAGNLTIDGHMSQDVSSALGKFGQLNLRKLVKIIPLVGFIPGQQRALIDYIPGLGFIPGVGGTPEAVNHFQVKMVGPLDDPGSVQSIRWLN